MSSAHLKRMGWFALLILALIGTGLLLWLAMAWDFVVRPEVDRAPLLVARYIRFMDRVTHAH